MAPEIALPDTLGDTILLSSLRGKYVILDFWASWDKQCKANNTVLMDVYKKYHHKGLEIYQVSIDKSEASWKKEINMEELSWHSVCDTRFWNSPTVNIYKVYNLPANFLIDREGKIVDFNIFGENLKNKLESVF